MQLISGELPGHIVLAEGATPPAGPSSSHMQPLAARLTAIWQGWLSCSKTSWAVVMERWDDCTLLWELPHEPRLAPPGVSGVVSWRSAVAATVTATVKKRLGDFFLLSAPCTSI